MGKHTHRTTHRTEVCQGLDQLIAVGLGGDAEAGEGERGEDQLRSHAESGADAEMGGAMLQRKGAQ